MGKPVYDKDDIIKIAAETAAKIAHEIIEKEKSKQFRQKHDKRLRNTKMLLQNYRMFKEHIKGAVFETDLSSEEDPIDILDLMWESPNTEIYVESIKKSVERTRIIMLHIDEMLSLYETYCFRSEKPEDKRRWRVTKMMYLDDVAINANDIAKSENIDKRTVYRDIGAAAVKISALIFGIDGITNKPK